MNAAHLHLALNHLPVVGIPIVAAILAWGAWRRSDEIVRLALTALVALAVAALGVYLTGEPAEEMVEDLVGVSEAALERHEEAAVWSMYGALAMGALAFAALVIDRGRRVSRPMVGAVLLAALAVSGSMAYTANLGGHIRHPEIRTGQEAEAGAVEVSGAEGPDERHEDD